MGKREERGFCALICSACIIWLADRNRCGSGGAPAAPSLAPIVCRRFPPAIDRRVFVFFDRTTSIVQPGAQRPTRTTPASPIRAALPNRQPAAAVATAAAAAVIYSSDRQQSVMRRHGGRRTFDRQLTVVQSSPSADDATMPIKSAVVRRRSILVSAAIFPGE
uniref:Secreted protein n=1 Tax=Plectus sambesii TaxID=2011161 RepID=A0A914UTG1_9BILA